MSDLELIRVAAWGDTDCQVKLAKAALILDAPTPADRVVSVVEGLTYARLAAATGNVEALGLVIVLQSQLADMLAQAGWLDAADEQRGEALAVADVAADVAGGSLGEIIAAHLLGAVEESDVQAMPSANRARRKWEDGE